MMSKTNTGNDDNEAISMQRPLGIDDIEKGTQASNIAPGRKEFLWTRWDDRDLEFMKDISSDLTFVNVCPIFPFFLTVSLRLEWLVWGEAYTMETEDNRNRGQEPPQLPIQAILGWRKFTSVAFTGIFSVVYGILDYHDFDGVIDSKGILATELSPLYVSFGYAILPALKAWLLAGFCWRSTFSKGVTYNNMSAILAAVGVYVLDLGYSDGGYFCILSTNVPKRALVHLFAGFYGTIWADTHANLDALLSGTPFTLGEWYCTQFAQLLIMCLFLRPCLPPFLLSLFLSMPFTSRIQTSSKPESVPEVLSLSNGNSRRCANGFCADGFPAVFTLFLALLLIKFGELSFYGNM